MKDAKQLAKEAKHIAKEAVESVLLQWIPITQKGFSPADYVSLKTAILCAIAAFVEMIKSGQDITSRCLEKFDHTTGDLTRVLLGICDMETALVMIEHGDACCRIAQATLRLGGDTIARTNRGNWDLQMVPWNTLWGQV